MQERMIAKPQEILTLRSEYPVPDVHLPLLDAEGNATKWDTVYGDMPKNYILYTQNLNVYYHDTERKRNKLAVYNVTIPIASGEITALIGPSGCGKSTVLRCFDRMNDVIPGTQVNGLVSYSKKNVKEMEPEALRKTIGMIAQTADLFSKSIYDNVAYGPRMHGITDRRKLDEIVKESLKKAAIYDDVKNDLGKLATKLSGGQQQRISIARALALNPPILLMDEPCSALDPITIKHFEKLMRDLVEKQRLTIVIVTHNMAQAARISDYAGFLSVRTQTISSTEEFKFGTLVEYGKTKKGKHGNKLFDGSPRHPETRAFIDGTFG